MSAKSQERVVFVVDARSMDINCGYLASEPIAAEKMVKFKHRGRAVAVPSLLCHDTLDAAKASLLKYLQSRAKSVEELEYDEENFWVA